MSVVNDLYTNFYIFNNDLLKAAGIGLFLRLCFGGLRMFR